LAVELIGENVDLSTGVTTNLGGVSVAYNSTDSEYLPVWFDSRISGQNDAYAQRVSASGVLVGDNITIISGSNSQTDTAVVHNSAQNQYLVTWRNQGGPPGSEGFNHAFGRIITASGGWLGREVDVSNGGLEATLAYNSTDDEYLLEARNFAGGGTAGIRGQRVSSGGGPLGGGITIATAGAPAPAGQVAYNGTDNQYLATWRDQTASDLKGRLINADGSLPGSAFVISSVFPQSGLAASVVFDPVNDRYLVVFGTFSGGPVLGQFVSPSGTPIGGSFIIFDSTANLNPFVAYDGVNEVFLVAWRDSGSGGIDAQLVDGDGSLLGAPLAIVTGTAYGAPRVAANSTEGGFAVVWADNRNSSEGHNDTFVQIVGVTTAIPDGGDLDCDGDVDLDDYAIFAACLAGPDVTTPPLGCDPDDFANADLDDDTDVDLQDFDVLTEVYTG
jgi:hypothetical protein